MKNLLFLLAAFTMITFSSCSKEEIAEAKLNCEHLEGELQLRPFCNFAPANSPDQPFPIAVWYQGSPVNLEGFTFLWDDTGSTASAVSVTYGNLPIVVEITEESTGCVVELSLTTDFWG